ncbi:MAG: HlyD family efflux transporter periplasmic adaptor subunit [Zhengella sp.]|uniref:efflux RND transporter periplasmic adaptor subunit n=1 Tax=Zhengella sp. TaxID=2282762 RepID=UPI001D325D3F|nr:HlyD family efflux transporter periplasmic adaptor subunit [Notoacmeibacter sp.]MCC0028437.1 HlyD family efflux transporter periplasmic adaptor subunit [Brucellaceae bacterium]
MNAPVRKDFGLKVTPQGAGAASGPLPPEDTGRLKAGGAGARAGIGQTAPSRLQLLLEIEGGLREAATEAELGQYIVDETGRILPWASACYLLLYRAWHGRVVLRHASGLAQPDRQSALAAALERAVALEAGRLAEGGPVLLRLKTRLPGSATTLLLAMPLRITGGRMAGCLVAPVAKAPGDADLVIAGRLASAYGHALTPFAQRRGRQILLARRRQFALAFAALAALALFIPVPLTVLAPAEIVPRDPIVVAAPIDGVVRRLLVDPNQPVRTGDLLAEFDDTELKGRFDVAARALDIAAARERRARQGAFTSREMRHDLAIAEAERRMAEAELAEARGRLDRAGIRAPSDGLVLYSNRDDWTGKPVSTGERILQIADPARLRVKIELAIGDTAALAGDGELRLFLDSDPLSPVAARIERAAYLAEPTPDNRLVYPVLAALDGGSAGLRAGLRGTAQIFGPSVSLGYFLFRRPIAALRQKLGI